jgi:hypothetical protein
MPTAFRYQDPKNKREQLTVTIDRRKAAELKPKKLTLQRHLPLAPGTEAV